jgi:hypothetical protein
MTKRIDLYADEKILIEENINYALEMYELYPNDYEISESLKLKGLNNIVIEQILHIIKQPAYEKRIKQAKKMIVTGIALVASLLFIAFLLKRIPNAASLLQGKGTDDKVLGGFFRFYSRIYYFIIILGVIRILTGVTLFFNYNKLLKSIQLSHKEI